MPRVLGLGALLNTKPASRRVVTAMSPVRGWWVAWGVEAMSRSRRLVAALPPKSTTATGRAVGLTATGSDGMTATEQSLNLTAPRTATSGSGVSAGCDASSLPVHRQWSPACGWSTTIAAILMTSFYERLNYERSSDLPEDREQ
jgi:hypothetical protein